MRSHVDREKPCGKDDGRVCHTLLSSSPRELVTLSDVTEANRKPSSKRRCYNSVYLNLSKREMAKRKEEEEERKRERERERKYERELVL